MDTLLLMKCTKVDFHPDKKIIKAGDYLAYIEASKIIESAQQEADRIVAEARAAYESEKKRGYEEGLEQGKGIMAQRMMDTVRKTVDYFATAEETLCAVVVNAIKKIIGEMDNKDLVTRVIRNALAYLRTQKQVVLRVSPVDFDSVQGKINEIMADFPGIGFIDVVADGRLNKNGCILESEIGVIDAGIDVQVEAIRRSLLKSIKRSD